MGVLTRTRMHECDSLPTLDSDLLLILFSSPKAESPLFVFLPRLKVRTQLILQKKTRDTNLQKEPPQTVDACLSV